MRPAATTVEFLQSLGKCESELIAISEGVARVQGTHERLWEEQRRFLTAPTALLVLSLALALWHF